MRNLMTVFARVVEGTGNAPVLRKRLLRCVALIALFPLIAAAADGKGAAGIETRCGWFVNASPGNAELLDRDGEWTVAIQGGHQAKGDWPPIFDKKQKVLYGVGGYGHGCACLRVQTNVENGTIERIHSSQGKPLGQCRRDPKLTEPRL